MTEQFEVVISGISGRFPECNDIPTCKKMLYNKDNFITEDNRKWPTNYKYKFCNDFVPPGTGKYVDINRFDTRVFSVSPALAECTDVINRKVLEPSFEAVMDAGYNPSSLMGANIGCYMVCTINETETIKTYSTRGGKLYLVGSSKSMESNRVSFALNLTGPSYTFHGCILGGLEALSAAYKSISDGTVEAAIVGGASSIIDPKLSLSFARMGYLSPDAFCRSFDKNANGYGRSEGSVCMFLQRAKDAKRSYGTLLFSECFYYGINTRPILGFEEDIIRKLIEEMYSLHKNVKPEDVSFVEMDACGVKKLEQLESNVIADIYCKNRNNPLLVGSVKSNMGHMDASAGLMSVLKALLALDTGYIAPNMHYSEPNPEIKPLVDGKLKVVNETTKLPGSMVGVNVMGISGLIGHVVLKQNPKTKTSTELAESDTLPRLIIVCGRTESGLKAVIENLELMPLNTEMIYMTNDVFKTPISTHTYRAYTILPAGTKPTNGLEVMAGETRPIWFVFSGMGSQWNGMGNGLLNIPIFANAIDRCDKVLRPKGIDIRRVLTSDDPTLFDDIVNAFVGIIAVQIGLVDVLKAIGIEPDGIIGHSLGENGCAYADGCLNLEQSILASWARGVASTEVKTVKGMMAAIGKGYEQVKDCLPEGIEVACHNSADNCTLTGPATIVNKYVEELQEQKVFAKAVNVANIAYHSKHIAPAAPILMRRLKEVISEPKERSAKWISTSVPEEDWDKPLAKCCSAEYLTNNLVSSVLFEEGSKHIPKNAIVIEIAPHGLLQAILKRSLNTGCTNIPLTLRSKNVDAVNFLLSAIGKMFIAGCQPDVNALYPKVEYPLPRGTPGISHLATWEHTEDWGSVDPLKDPPLSEELINVRLNKGSQWHYLKGHKVKGQTIIPPSVYMYLAWHMLSVIKNESIGSSNIVFEDVKIHKNLYITIEKYRVFTILIQLGSGSFEVLLENEKDSKNVKVIMTGIIQVPFETLKINVNDDQAQNIKIKITRDDFYKNLENLGYQLDDNFKDIQELSFTETECFGKITWNNNWVCFLDAIMKLYMYSEGSSKNEVLFPSRFRKLVICTSTFNALKPGDEVFCHKDLVTKQLWCNGLELSDFKYIAPKLDILELETDNNKLQSLQFIPHTNPSLQNIGEFINLSLQLTIESASSAIYESSSKLHIIDTTNIATLVKKILKHNFDLKSKIIFTETKEVNTAIFTDKNYHLLIANNFANVDKLYNPLKSKLGNLFVLIIQPLSETFKWENEKSFVEVAKASFNEIGVYFYKKVTETFEHAPPVIVADNNWMLKCAPALKNQKTQPIVVLRNEIELPDLSVILSRQKQYPFARFLYILDEDAPHFSVENPVYKNQILKDLPVAVFKDGQWGSYRNLKINHLNLSNRENMLDIHDLRLKTVDIMYLCHDYKAIQDEDTTRIPEYEHGIEFSGISDTGKRVMGLGYYNPLESLKEPDPLLTWQVPKSWSLEEAVTVPLYYAQAYNAIFLIPTRDTSKSILINANLALTEACVAIALHESLNVFATVDTNMEAEILKRKFPLLNERNILSRNNYKYELELKLSTKGDGVDLVINSFSSAEHLNAALNCLRIYGQYVEISDGRNYTDLKLGLSVFLKSVSFSVQPNYITSLLRLPTESKERLHSLIEYGLRENVIQPLTHTVYGIDDDDHYYRNVIQENKKIIYKCLSKQDISNENTNTKLRCDENRSFIIITGGKKSNLWFELVEWLIQKGAKKFIVALDNFSLGPKLSHQINRLLVQKKATIILTSSKKAETVQDASGLLAEANNVAPLEAVFFVSLDPASAIAHNIDAASKFTNPFHFICLLSGGLKECERRKNNGLPAVLIHSEKAINKFSDILPRMESLLTKFNTTNSPTLYDLTNNPKKRSNDLVAVRLSNYFVADTERLEDIGYHGTDTPRFVEVPTLAKPYAETKGVYPMFVVPSVDQRQLKHVLRNFLYPTFCATFSEYCSSASNVALQLYKDVQRIQPDGPITLLGETWCAPIAIELASLLQSNNRIVELFLIEGSPETWKRHIRTLGEINTPQFESNFLKYMLNFDPKMKVDYENQSASHTWEEYLEKYIAKLNTSNDVKANVRKAINGIRNRLIMAVKYTPQGESLKHLTLLKHRPCDGSLDKYCLAYDIHFLEEENYQEFVKSHEVSTIIHENALFKWRR